MNSKLNIPEPVLNKNLIKSSTLSLQTAWTSFWRERVELLIELLRGNFENSFRHY